MTTMCTARCPFVRRRSARVALGRTVHAGRGRPAQPYDRRVPSLTNATKRLVIGRPLRSDRLHETLLPKRIALPVFASDALSSVAYAPEEILATLAVAGASAYAFSPWIGLAVAVVMLTVVAS